MTFKPRNDVLQHTAFSVSPDSPPGLVGNRVTSFIDRILAYLAIAGLSFGYLDWKSP